MKNGIKTFVCLGCNKTITKSCNKTIKYCSRDCYNKYGKYHNGRKTGQRTGVFKNCNSCGKSFYVSKCRINKAIVCSISCQVKWQQRNKIIVTCIICEKSFSVSPVFKNKKYCSIKCRNNDPEVKKRLVRMNLAQQKNIKPNKIEQIGYNVLTSHNIDFESQKLMFNKFCVDAFLPNINTVIQFDGDYWHGNPNKFKKLDKRQKKRSNLDKSQDSYMQKAGINVIRIWESEILHNSNIIIQKIKH